MYLFIVMNFERHTCREILTEPANTPINEARKNAKVLNFDDRNQKI